MSQKQSTRAKRKLRIQFLNGRTVGRSKSRLDEAEDQISELEDKVEKNTGKSKKRKTDSEIMKTC